MCGALLRRPEGCRRYLLLGGRGVAEPRSQQSSNRDCFSCLELFGGAATTPSSSRRVRRFRECCARLAARTSARMAFSCSSSVTFCLSAAFSL